MNNAVVDIGNDPAERHNLEQFTVEGVEKAEIGSARLKLAIKEWGKIRALQKDIDSGKMHRNFLQWCKTVSEQRNSEPLVDMYLDITVWKNINDLRKCRK